MIQSDQKQHSSGEVRASVGHPRLGVAPPRRSLGPKELRDPTVSCPIITKGPDGRLRESRAGRHVRPPLHSQTEAPGGTRTPDATPRDRPSELQPSAPCSAVGRSWCPKTSNRRVTHCREGACSRGLVSTHGQQSWPQSWPPARVPRASLRAQQAGQAPSAFPPRRAGSGPTAGAGAAPRAPSQDFLSGPLDHWGRPSAHLLGVAEVGDDTAVEGERSCH